MNQVSPDKWSCDTCAHQNDYGICQDCERSSPPRCADDYYRGDQWAESQAAMEKRADLVIRNLHAICLRMARPKKTQEQREELAQHAERIAREAGHGSSPLRAADKGSDDSKGDGA